MTSVSDPTPILHKARSVQLHLAGFRGLVRRPKVQKEATDTWLSPQPVQHPSQTVLIRKQTINVADSRLLEYPRRKSRIPLFLLIERR